MEGKSRGVLHGSRLDNLCFQAQLYQVQTLLLTPGRGEQRGIGPMQMDRTPCLA